MKEFEDGIAWLLWRVIRLMLLILISPIILFMTIKCNNSDNEEEPACVMLDNIFERNIK